MNIQFYVSVVKEIAAYRKALKEAGIDCDNAPQRPAIARIAAPSAFSTDKSADCLALESKWEEMTGKGFRCSPEMAAMFALPDDRAGRIARMIELVQAGKAVRGVSGWMPSAGSVQGVQGDDENETF